jgi:hypothetical protein
MLFQELALEYSSTSRGDYWMLGYESAQAAQHVVFYIILQDCLGSFSADASGELDVLGHDGDSLGVDGGQVGVLEETDEVSFSGFLESQHGGSLESEIVLKVLSNFSDQSLERKLADQQLSALLILSDFSESDGSWAISVGLLDSSGSGGRLSGSLGGELLSRSLSSGRLSCGLLGSGHFA